MYKCQHAQISLFDFGMTRLSCTLLTIFIPGSSENNTKLLYNTQLHRRRPRDGQSGWEKRCDKSFQPWVEEPLGTDSHRTISKQPSECWLLIEHKKCFVLLCPISEQHLLSSFREFVHDSYRLDHSLSGSCTKEMHVVWKLSV